MAQNMTQLTIINPPPTKSICFSCLKSPVDFPRSRAFHPLLLSDNQ